MREIILYYSVSLQGNQPRIFIARLMLRLKLQYFGHPMQRADSLEKTLMRGKIEGRRKRGWQRLRWLDGITNLVDMNLSKLQKMVKDRKAWCAEVHGVAKSQTWLNNWTTAPILWANVFAGVLILIKGRQECQSQSWKNGGEDKSDTERNWKLILLVLKLENGALTQVMWVTSMFWKSLKKILP